MFGYEDLLKETELFCRNGVETGIVGNSEQGRRIPYIFVGRKNGHYMIVQAAIHAREHLTSLLCVNLAKSLVRRRPTLNGGIYFVPMTNPDGVELCQHGAKGLDKTERARLVAMNGGKTDFALWKANANGVDLNVNFDACWGEGKQNVFVPSSQNYVGDAPESAKETKALVRFTQRIKPDVTISYHLKGEEVYWEFGQTSHRRFRDRRYAEAIAQYTGYKLASSLGSTGGYKDWCVQQLKIPSFTIEVGNDKYGHPFPYEELVTICEQNEDLPRRLLNTVVRDKLRLEEVGLEDLLK